MQMIKMTISKNYFIGKKVQLIAVSWEKKVMVQIWQFQPSPIWGTEEETPRVWSGMQASVYGWQEIRLYKHSLLLEEINKTSQYLGF